LRYHDKSASQALIFMASLNYLFSHRARFSVGSTNFFKSWTKRVLSLPDVLEQNLRRSSFVRHGAIVHETAEIGKVVSEGRKNNLTVGQFSFLGRVFIALHDNIRIGDRVCINDGVRLLTASHDIADPKWGRISAEIVIEDYVWIGMGAIILPGVKLGRGAVVGAGAVVSKSVVAGSIVVGNPARPISKTRTEELNYNPCEWLAANRAWLIG
jgi:acetyltransferase-like isoleucine patch superfamily enzyme